LGRLDGRNQSDFEVEKVQRLSEAVLWH
jgi:hypothetical protein